MTDVVTILDDDGALVVVTEPQTVVIAEVNTDIELVTVDEQQTVVITETVDTDSVVTITDDLNVVITEEDAQVIVTLGEQGPPGRDGTNGGDTVQVSFSYGDATPAIITTAIAGKIIYRVAVHISVPFDGAGASLTIGDALVTYRLASAIEIDPTIVGSSETSPAYAYGVDTQILLSIDPGAGASQGSGLVTMYIQQ